MKKTIFCLAIVLFANICLSQTWVLKNSTYPNSATIPFVAVINDKAYLGTETNMVEFDPLTNTYTTKTPPSACSFGSHAPTFVINNKMYVVDPNPPNHLFEYNQLTDTWIQKNAVPPFYGSWPPDPNQALLVGSTVFSFTINNKAYLGGFSAMNTVTSVQYFLPYFYEYDPIGDSYLSKANLPVNYNIVDGRSFSINDKGYTIGGIGLMGMAAANAHCYDQTLDAWSGISTQMHGSTHPGGYFGGVFVLGGKAYYGMSTSNFYEGDSLIESYDPVQNTWNVEPRVPINDTIRMGVGFTINGKGYMGLGTICHSSIPGCIPHFNLYEFSLDYENVEISEDFSAFKIFPNPAADILNIENCKENSLILILDLLGKTKIAEQTNKYHTSIDISGLETGTYFIKMINEKGSTTGIFIKNK
ncbi:MAG TPA: T9SS type A sorting domain-containing protein [Bacteroidales bacterium]|nr:T9SS type A sorting domain-containing protein [Bacteroidales bacterium]